MKKLSRYVLFAPKIRAFFISETRAGLNVTRQKVYAQIFYSHRGAQLAAKNIFQGINGLSVAWKRDVKKKPSKKAEKRYKAFTGKEPEGARTRNLQAPPELICIARAEYITYYSDKLNGGGDGVMRGFKHRFGPQIHIYTDPKGTFLVLAGPGLKVTPRGIVG